MQVAATLGADKAEPNFYAGAILLALGDRPHAAQHFEVVRRLNPNFHIQFINTHTNGHYDKDVEAERDLVTKAIMASCPDGTLCCETTTVVRTARLCRLLEVIRTLREFEESLEFVATRQIDGMIAARRTGYMKHNFAYGSTFFPSWLQIASVKPVSDALDSLAVAGNGRIYGVLGSSLGWHAFFGSLAAGVTAKGWEILCSQVDFSNAVVRQYGLESLVSFECSDALDAPLSDVGLLVLAFSRDVDLGQKLNNKMAEELPSGAVVRRRAPRAPRSRVRRSSRGPTSSPTTPPSSSTGPWRCPCRGSSAGPCTCT